MRKSRIKLIGNFWEGLGLLSTKIVFITFALLLHGVFAQALAEFEVPIMRMDHSYFKSPDGRLLMGKADESELQKLANTAGALILANGYRCDSISWMAPATRKLKTYYKVRCNGLRYTYGIFDKGGKWVVELL